MRSVGPPLMPIFRSRHQAEFLMWLLLHPNQEYSLTDLAARLAVPLTTLHREAVRLEDAGLITSRSLGRNRLLRANTDHPAAPGLTQVLEVTFGPKAVIAEEFSRLDAEQVLIFGSWAARYSGQDGLPPRDIDVLVIGSVDRTDLYDAADRAQSRLGIEVNPVLRSPDEWNRKSDGLIVQISSSDYVVALDRHKKMAG